MDLNTNRANVYTRNKKMELFLDEIVVLKGREIIAQEQVDDIRALYGMDTTSWLVRLFNNHA